ncbi:hypothetical protein [Pedobacter jejuensis]|uniref:hypothetical protein n=1 Tax=Pedobacter jejuensis TaxID=1268550 RepID=UPI0011CD91EE|nr:hypothetical protein [Pedobacter jejuensis]
MQIKSSESSNISEKFCKSMQALSSSNLPICKHKLPIASICVAGNIFSALSNRHSKPNVPPIVSGTENAKQVLYGFRFLNSVGFNLQNGALPGVVVLLKFDTI